MANEIIKQIKLGDSTYDINEAAGTNLGLVKTGGDVTISDGVIGVNSVHSSDGNFALNANFNIDGKKAILFAANSTSVERYQNTTTNWYGSRKINPTKGLIIENTCTGTIKRSPEASYTEMEVYFNIPID